MAKSKPERDLTLDEVRQMVAIGLRDKVNAVAEKFKDLKTREVSRKLGKHELCPLCGNADIPGSCTCVGLSKSEDLNKKSPPGKFKDLPEKLKEKGYSADSAFAISWAAKNKADAKKSDLDKNALMGYDSNGETNGGMPNGGPGMAMAEKMDKSELCKNCGMAHAPGRDYDHTLEKALIAGAPATSGQTMPPIKKEEITEIKFEKCKKCGATHKINVSYDHELVKENDANVPVDDPLGPEAVLPDDKKVKEPDETGSGGETKKLAKAGALEGLMGGSFKPKGSMAPIPSPGSGGMHPNTAAGLSDVRAISPAATAQQPFKPSYAHLSPVVRANAQMAKFKSIAHNPLAMPGNTPLVNPNAMTGHAVSGQITAKPAPAIAQAPAGQPKVQVQADAAKPGQAQSAVQDAANLAADKKAGGVGWLNSLISRFRKPVAAPIGTGPVRSQMSPFQGIRGAAALARSESFETDLRKSLGNCVLCNKEEHLGNC